MEVEVTKKSKTKYGLICIYHGLPFLLRVLNFTHLLLVYYHREFVHMLFCSIHVLIKLQPTCIRIRPLYPAAVLIYYQKHIKDS